MHAGVIIHECDGVVARTTFQRAHYLAASVTSAVNDDAVIMLIVVVRAAIDQRTNYQARPPDSQNGAAPKDEEHSWRNIVQANRVDHQHNRDHPSRYRPDDQQDRVQPDVAHDGAVETHQIVGWQGD